MVEAKLYKIFINDKPLIITNKIENVDESFKELPGEMFSISKVQDYIKSCEAMSGKGLILLSDDVDSVFESIKKQLLPIEASGGIVFNSNNQILLIKRLGKWDLPKGKIDAGETPQIAAVREVEEECGMKNLQIQSFFTTTYHIYKMHNYRFLKISYWYLMFSDYKGKLIPQTEEQISDVSWFDLNENILMKIDTYASIKDLLKLVLNKKSKNNETAAK